MIDLIQYESPLFERASSWHGIPIQYYDEVRKMMKAKGLVYLRYRFRGPRISNRHCVGRGRANCVKQDATSFAVYFGSAPLRRSK